MLDTTTESVTSYTELTFIKIGTEGTIEKGTFHPLLITEDNPPKVVNILTNTTADLSGCKVTREVLEDQFGSSYDCLKVTHPQGTVGVDSYYVPVRSGRFIFIPEKELRKIL